MPKKFVGSRVLGADSEDRLFIEKKQPRLAVVFYQPSADKLDESDKYESEAHYSKAKRKLLEFDAQRKRLTIFPVNTLEHHPDFLKRKYGQIESIIIENWDVKLPKSTDDVSEMLQGLPAGFIKDFSYGLGFVKDYRFVITSIEKIPEVRHLILGSGGSGLSGNTYTLNLDDYDAIRRGLNRITDGQQREAVKDKSIFAHNALLTALDPKRFPEASRPYRKDTIFKLISNGAGEQIKLSEADQEAAVRLVEQNKREIAKNAPQNLQRLRDDLELASLEVLIAKYEEMLDKDLGESRWQALFNENPFILNLAFSYSVVKIQGQAHVGGRTLAGSGETIADFLVKNRLSNNAALFEIKKPGTRLLRDKPYREQLYAPSSELAGAMSQMLDQKHEFQQDIAGIKHRSSIPDLEAYSVHGVLVIGTAPKDSHQQKSFELFRGNSKDIAVVTFDELLGKLKSLHEFLSSNAPGAHLASKLHALETKMLRLQREFHGLYSHSESRSGSIRQATMKPLPGVDGRAVMSAGGKLSILQMGFENVRLEKPPFPVAFDDPGERAIKVETVEEFVEQAEAVLAKVEAVLAEQIRSQQKR